MIFEVRLFAEPPVADVTFKGPRSVMNIHVTLQIPWRRERLGAHGTLMGLLLEIHINIVVRLPACGVICSSDVHEYNLYAIVSQMANS
jgi:threonine dehydrogenase-like Zn-dependent dehydrogenase